MKKNVVFIGISISLLVLLGIGVSYSMWNITVNQDTVSTMHTDCFDLTISNKNNNISLENAYPISNSKDMKLTPYTFKITNTCNITAEYSINLEVLKNSTLSSEFIDVMLNGNINLLSSYDKTEKIDNFSIESRKIDTGILKSNESKDYSLRLWTDYDTTLEDLNNENKVFKAKVNIVGKPINYSGDTVFGFDYTGSEQTFTVPVSGTYKLETWGAQGGTFNDNYYGGYGGYSQGIVNLSSNQEIYLNIGGTTLTYTGGYNGGGNGDDYVASNNPNVVNLYLGGGGATHISSKSGILKNLENYKSNIFIVSGGGGGLYYYSSDHISVGGHAGGYVGNNGNVAYSSCNAVIPIGSQGGTQTSGGLGNNSLTNYKGTFGQGGNGANGEKLGTGGGGGYYGGGGTFNMGCSSESGAGGSGYIGNTLLTNKIMYCYNCEESSEVSTKTVSTTCSEETPTSYCAKKGNGYARITLISIDN